MGQAKQNFLENEFLETITGKDLQGNVIEKSFEDSWEDYINYLRANT